MNKSFSADAFFTEFKFPVQLLEKHLERANLEKIFKMCRLKPAAIIFDNSKKKLKVYDEWIDEYKNLVSLRNKKLYITYNDLTYDKVITTDLYFNIHLSKIVKISKFVFCLYGKTEENEDIYLLTFLGIDNYFRSYLYLNEWTQVSPLLNGIGNLLKMSSFLATKKMVNFKNRKTTGLPCAAVQAWLSCIPCEEHEMRVIEGLCPNLKGVLFN